MENTYEQLENIIDTLDVLLNEINDIALTEYVDELQEILDQAKLEKEQYEESLKKEYDKEEKFMDEQFIKGRL